MEHSLVALDGSLAASDRPAAEDAWRTAYVRYLHLGAVYLTGQLGVLNQEIDGTASGLEDGVRSAQFLGLHRLEYGLWTGEPLGTLLTFARRLDAAVREFARILPGVSVSALEYSTRAHEILEDAQRDLLSGSDVPWSHEGVLATEAGLEATEEVISTVRDRLDAPESLLPAITTELAALRSVMTSITAMDGGRLPSNGQLTQSQAERLDGALGGALEALSQVPGALESEAQSVGPQIPAGDIKIDR